MFYLARAGISNPAEAPHLARLDENYEWGYGQSKHQECLKTIKGLVDQSAPKTRDAATQRAQASTRKFCEDQKRAEIGRENRKLVDRLSTIARGSTDRGDPRGPPPTSSLAGNAMRGRQRPSAVEAATAHAAALERSKSLNSQFRKKTQRHIDQDNAALVRRILAVKSTFDRKEEVKHFKRHERTVHLLQRLPEPGSGAGDAAGKGGASRKRGGVPRSLPPLRHSRSAIMTAPVTGLKELFVPGELRRSTSLSGLGSDNGSLDGPRPLYLSNGPSGTAVEADLGFQRKGRGPFSPGGDGLDPDSGRTLNEAGAFGDQTDAETERRQWLMEEEARRSRQEQSQSQDGSPSRGGQAAPSNDNPWLSGPGMSGSDMPKFAEGWDENSFENSSGSPTKSRATGAGWRADPGLTVHEDTVSNFGLQGQGRDQPSMGVGLAGGAGGGGGIGSSEDMGMPRTLTGTSFASYASDGFESDATESGTESEVGSTTRGASRSMSGTFNNKRAR